MDRNEVYEKIFLKPIIFWGAATCLLAAVWSFASPLYLYFFHGAIPSAEQILTGFGLILTFSGILWIVEPPSYFPILGVPGTYMAFLSGNISNVRVPCSAIAQSAAGVEEGTKEGSIISTIAIGASIIVNIVVLTFGVVFGAKFLASCPPMVTESLKYILPAVFGGVFGQFAVRNYKLAAIALVLSIVLIKLKFVPVWLLVPLCVFGTLYIGVWMRNRAAKQAQEAKG